MECISNTFWNCWTLYEYKRNFQSLFHNKVLEVGWAVKNRTYFLQEMLTDSAWTLDQILLPVF